MIRTILLVVLIGLLPAEGKAQSPSFDCGLARTGVEIAICESAHLSDLDVYISDIYLALPSQIRSRLLPLQKNWLRRRDGCALSEHVFSCIRDASNEQLTVLSHEKETVEMYVPMSGVYGNTSQFYSNSVGEPKVWYWRIFIHSSGEPNQYIVHALSDVGAYNHFCEFILPVQRQGYSFFFDHGNNASEAQGEARLIYDPNNLTLEFRDFDESQFCFGHAYLSEVTYFLQR